MYKQWKPGPFLLPFSGLGTRLGSVTVVPQVCPAVIQVCPVVSQVCCGSVTHTVSQ